MIHVISGKYARRQVPIVGRTRPPLQRTKVLIFDVLSNIVEIPGSIVLDLCAGSGSFGLECASRGAEYVYFVEENVATASNLRQTLALWKVDNAKVIRLNVNYLPEAQVKSDLIFLDPPFGHKYVAQIVKRLVDKGWTHKNTIILIRVDYSLELPLRLLYYKKTGISHMYFYRIGEE